MGLKLQTPIATARGILQDPDGVRYSDADLLVYANDALDVLVEVQPQWFERRQTLLATPSSVAQELSEVTLGHAVRAVTDVVYSYDITGSGAVSEADPAVLDAFSPGWRNDSTIAGRAIHWLRDRTDPRKFGVYPMAHALLSTFDVVYVMVPPEYTAAQDTGLPIHLSDAVSDYIVHRAESRDDEHINSNRAAQFLQSFASKIKGQ